MRIKFLKEVSGLQGYYRANSVVDLEPDLAKSFIKNNQAVAVKEESEPPKQRKVRKAVVK